MPYQGLATIHVKVLKAVVASVADRFFGPKEPEMAEDVSAVSSWFGSDPVDKPDRADWVRRAPGGKLISVTRATLVEAGGVICACDCAGKHGVKPRRRVLR